MSLKLIATSDTHFPITKAEMFPAGDILVIAGDVLYAGNINEWYPFLESLALPHIQQYKHKLFVPGNHDIFFQHYAGPCMQEMRKLGVHCLTPTGPTTEIEGVRFGGCPFVTNLPNWAYNSDEDSIWGYLESLRRVDVMISHSPPRGVLDSDGRGNYGTGAMRKYLAHYEPEVLICGHVHEQGGLQTVVGRTHVYNVSMCNSAYQQVTPATVIDIG